MKIEHLISTMKVKTIVENEELVNKMKIKTSSITISQIKEKKLFNNKSKCDITINETINDKIKHLLILSDKIGLSNSRNDALNNSRTDICIISDDDVIYEDNYLDLIKNAYKDNPDADIIIFNIINENFERKTSKIYNKNINFINAMRVSSNQITFRRSSIIENNLNFDINFGTGGKNFLGEDTIFIYDALKKGLKIVYNNNIILKMPKSKSSWFEKYDEMYFKSLGACYYRISKRFYKLLIFQFAIRKYNRYKNDISIIDAIKQMKNGVKNYIELLNGTRL